MPVVTTLNFNGRTEEAINFYAKALGSETLFLMRFRESPLRAQIRPDTEDLVFHATFRIEGTEFMASDVGALKDRSEARFSGFSLAINLSSLEKAQRYFSALSHEGRIVIPLSKSAFTSWYGIVEDRFGLSWKINVDSQSG